jgi:hypothetical protein
LKLSVGDTAGGRVGAANLGFWNPANGDGWSKWLYASRRSEFSGMNVRRGAGYRYSLYARSEPPLKQPLRVSLETPGGTVLAAADVAGVGADWKKFDGELAASGDEANARLVVTTTEHGTLWLDMVSLFPKDTFKGLPFRKDLMELMAATRPGFPAARSFKGSVMKTRLTGNKPSAIRRSAWRGRDSGATSSIAGWGFMSIC